MPRKTRASPAVLLLNKYQLFSCSQCVSWQRDQQYQKVGRFLSLIDHNVQRGDIQLYQHSPGFWPFVFFIFFYVAASLVVAQSVSESWSKLLFWERNQISADASMATWGSCFHILMKYRQQAMTLFTRPMRVEISRNIGHWMTNYQTKPPPNHAYH